MPKIMKVKKPVLFLSLLFLAAVLCVDGHYACAAESSPLLGEILRKTEQQYQQIHAFTAIFHQWTTSSAASSMKTEAQGKLFYQKPRQMRWEYDKPEHQIFVANSKVAWLYAPADKQISLFESKTLFASPLAQTFFDGMVELKKNFEVSLDSRQSTKASAVLKLTPRHEDPNIKSLTLTVDLQTYHIASVESHDALGNVNRITLDSQHSVSNLDPKLFQLDIPPSTTVLDMEGKELPPSEIERLKKQAAAP